MVRLVRWLDQPACVCAKLLQSCPTLLLYGLYPLRLLCSWDSPRKDTGVGYHALLQGIFPTQGLNPSLLSLHWQTGSFSLGLLGKPQPAQIPPSTGFITLGSFLNLPEPSSSFQEAKFYIIK